MGAGLEDHAQLSIKVSAEDVYSKMWRHCRPSAAHWAVGKEQYILDVALRTQRSGSVAALETGRVRATQTAHAVHHWGSLLSMMRSVSGEC
jgi:hypothetical protein